MTEQIKEPSAEYVNGLRQQLAELLEAAKTAQCDCSPKERDSGHKSECWFPALREAIAKASNPNADVQQVAPQGRWTEKGTV